MVSAYTQVTFGGDPTARYVVAGAGAVGVATVAAPALLPELGGAISSGFAAVASRLPLLNRLGIAAAEIASPTGTEAVAIGGAASGVAAGSNGSALQDASDAAFRAADNIGSWTPKNKHMAGGGSQSKAKFLGTEDDARAATASALRSESAEFRPNPLVEGTFQVRGPGGGQVGIRGQEDVKAIVGSEGQVINAYPVH